MEHTVKIINRWTVTVELTYVGNPSIMSSFNAATVRPFTKPDGSVDELAVADYTDFVINLLGVFDRSDFEVIEERESPYSHSFYFDLVKKDQAANKDYKYVLYIRVSDHPLDKAKASSQRKWFASHANEQKQPKTKSKQVWKLHNIIVNQDTYNTYDEALDATEEKLSIYK